MPVQQCRALKRLRISWSPEVFRFRLKSIHSLRHGKRKQEAEDSDRLNLFVLCLKYTRRFFLEQQQGYYLHRTCIIYIESVHLRFVRLTNYRTIYHAVTVSTV